MDGLILQVSYRRVFQIAKLLLGSRCVFVAVIRLNDVLVTLDRAESKHRWFAILPLLSALSIHLQQEYCLIPTSPHYNLSCLAFYPNL